MILHFSWTCAILVLTTKRKEHKMSKATVESLKYAEGLSEKFSDEYAVLAGMTYDKVVRVSNHGGRSVHAFVIRGTGQVLKAATWKAPAKGVRYETVDEALEASDRFGSYLYVS